MPQNLFNIPIVTNGDMSSDITSDITDLSKVDGYAVYAKWTGTPQGSIKLQVSVDGINYVDLDGSSTVVNNAGEALWEVTTAFYDKVRLVYTSSSSTGTLNAQINGKGTED